MKSSTRLDSAVFKLTPTRTRCDLLISANGKTEKMASGLLNPFIAHLKTAQEQMAKGGYSIILEPAPGSDATWFTKGTVERFVRFVSNPEVLERVYTTESEILQIEEAIAIQSNNDMGLGSAEGTPTKPVQSIQGSRPVLESNEDKAIVVYKPEAHPPEANGSTVPEGNPKVQLLKVLETRKTVLQKEQGMAFARAVAAGFDVDHMSPLMSFAESFGALRLKDACVRFRELWKRKHETGQWLEFEAEAMSNQPDFSAPNASGIVLSSMVNKFSENGKAGIDSNAGEKPIINQQSVSNQEYVQGQFPHPMFPPWPVHSPPGAPPVFQGYPMQGMPYYPANSGYFHPPYGMEDPRQNTGQRVGQGRHAMDSRDSSNGFETWETDGSKARSQDNLELDGESSRKKGGRSGKKQSGKVVIRNINYITSNKQNSSDSESQSASNSESEEEDGDIEVSTPRMKHKSSSRSSKIKGSHMKSGDASHSSKVEGSGKSKDEDGGQWHAFQNYLLRDADEEERPVGKGMFAMEKGVRARRRENILGNDPLVSNGRDAGEYHQENLVDIDKFSGNIARTRNASNDELLILRRVGQSGDGRRFTNGRFDVQSTEIDGSRGGYRRNADDDFMIRSQSALANPPSDSWAINRFEQVTNNLDRNSSHNMDDDSYIVPLRSVSPGKIVTDGRNAIDMDSEFPSSYQKEENTNNRDQSLSFEPDELTLLPDRGAENRLTGYDPALDYEMQAEGASRNKKNREPITDVKQGSKKLDKERKSKLMDTSDKKKTSGPIRKGKPSKLSPLDEARARAEKLRSFKADMQKLKKQKEEEEAKRLEALKIQRQKRIAARGSSTTAQSTLSSQLTRKQLPTKLSPSANKSSKFSDSEPGPSSPLQRFPVRTASVGSIDSQKASKPTKLSTGSLSGGNRLTRSVSSLPEPKKENTAVTPNIKVSMTRIRRLSEPKMSSSQHVSVMARSAEPVSKQKASDGSETKKISAIMNYDKTKAASLPELKIRKSKELAVAHSKPATKELAQKVNETKSASTSEGAELKRNNDNISHLSDADENLVIEKTVVMLESEKPSIPIVNTIEENMWFQKQPSDDHRREKNKAVTDYVAIRAPVSPLTTIEVDKEQIDDQLQEQSTTYEIGLVTAANFDDAEKETPKFPSVGVSEKTYHAPYARVSSLEDPCTRISQYGRATASTTAGTEMVKAHISDCKNMNLEKIPDALDKPQTKESSKGFRRLLKFAKRNHSSTAGDCNADSDDVSVNGSEGGDVITNTAAAEVHTLKNLISQDETPTAASTPPKSSRSFSLLSPFRSKNSEKKLTS